MSGIIISTRVRLARNLKDYPFPCRLSEQGRHKVNDKVRAAITQSNSVLQNDFEYIELEKLTPTESVSLVEKRLVSPEFISDTSGRALLLSSDRSLSIMINEEDHIRLQVIKKGLALEEVYETADRLDTLARARKEQGDQPHSRQPFKVRSDYPRSPRRGHRAQGSALPAL